MWQELAATLNELNKIYQQMLEIGKPQETKEAVV